MARRRRPRHAVRPPEPPTEDTVAEADARRVWRAAARLQAEAARRLDARSETLARTHAPNEPDRAAFTRAEVIEIAEAAGIDSGFLELAWREVAAEGLATTPVSDARHARASAFLGTDVERLSVTRTFRAAPDAVLAAMERVFPADPYRLTLAEVVGESDALTDSVLIFDVPQVGAMAAQTGGYTPFSYAMTIADLTRAVVTLHPLGDGRTEATVTVDLRHGKARNFTVGGWLTGLVAALGGAFGLALGIALGDGGLIAATGAGLGSTGTGALTYAGYRAAYASGLRKGEAALSDLLRAVDVSIRSGGAFAPPSARPRSGTADDEALSGLLGGL
ncbi:hypothetical protein [Rubrivirga marina]|uniref:Uncharacterized protein n=1 Tax=Rubrivirga marina TaxID=1196024 RepID=A0A271IYL5_9BACT|nr:hypothetical protein [Rubrivirga marina]PAP76313.1 hypothetical protein BSZ37_07570 [Rubrivirga marina]